MDITLVQDAQYDINDQDGDSKKQCQILYGILELSRRPLKCAADGRRQVARQLTELIDCLAQGKSWPEIE